MDNNKGIIITGGNIKANNIAVGKNSKIEQSQQLKKDAEAKNGDSGDKDFADKLKKAITKGELKKVIGQLLVYFKENDNKEGLNATIMFSSSLTQLDMQENLSMITHEQGKIDRAKVISSVLQLIDNQIM